MEDFPPLDENAIRLMHQLNQAGELDVETVESVVARGLIDELAVYWVMLRAEEPEHFEDISNAGIEEIERKFLEELARSIKDEEPRIRSATEFRALVCLNMEPNIFAGFRDLCEEYQSEGTPIHLRAEFDSMTTELSGTDLEAPPNGAQQS